MRLRPFVFACTLVFAGPARPAGGAETRLDYRVVYASRRDLGRQLESAGRDGYACLAVARPDPGAAPPGVVVLLGRPAGPPASPVSNRVVAGGWAGTDLEPLLDRAGGEGFRLCGVILDEGPPNPALVAVMSRRGDSPVPARYGVEVLTNYKESLVRLNARGAEGFVPVAAAPVNSSRVPEMRSWLVVIERAGPSAVPREIAVRSNSGPDGFRAALNENGSKGYRLDAAWKEGNDFVAMMSRPVGGAGGATFAYAVDATGASGVHFFHGLCLADLPHRGDERLLIGDRGVSASNDVEEDPLPTLPKTGFVDAEALDVLGGHLSRHGGFTPAFARIRRGANGTFVLATV